MSVGHARALLTADDPITLARLAVARGLSVREVEKRAKAKPPGERKKRPAPKDAKDADTVALEGDLSATVGMPVSNRARQRQWCGLRHDPLCRSGRAG